MMEPWSSYIIEMGVFILSGVVEMKERKKNPTQDILQDDARSVDVLWSASDEHVSIRCFYGVFCYLWSWYNYTVRPTFNICNIPAI